MIKFITMLMALLCSLTCNAQETEQIAEESFSFSGELMILLWIAIVAVLFICARLKAKCNFLTGTMYYTRWGVFLLLCALELVYVSDLYSHLGDEGFPLFLLIFLIPFGLTAVLQIKTFFDIIEDYQYNYGVQYSFYWAPIVLVVSMIAVVISVVFDAQIIFGSALSIAIISQIVFIAVLFIKVFKSQNLITALMCVATYIIGIASIVLLAGLVLFGMLLFKVGKHTLGGMLTPTPTNTYPYNY